MQLMGSMNREIKKISEDIKTNTFKQFYLFYGEEKYMILQLIVRKAHSFRRGMDSTFILYFNVYVSIDFIHIL